jgi:hypothetical protein
MEYLSFQDLLEAGHVSRQWRFVSQSPNVWRDQTIALTSSGILVDGNQERPFSLMSKLEESDYEYDLDYPHKKDQVNFRRFNRTNVPSQIRKPTSRPRVIPINKLSKEIIKRLKHVQHLTTPHNDIQDEDVLQMLQHTPNLVSLDLSRCHSFTGLAVLTAIQSISTDASRVSLQHLKSLNLSRTGIKDETLRDLLHNCPSLEHLDISYCGRVTDVGLKWICVDSTTSDSTSSLSNVSFVRRVKSLNLAGCSLLTGLGVLRALLMLAESGTKLETLNLSNHYFITAEIASAFITRRKQTKITYLENRHSNNSAAASTALQNPFSKKLQLHVKDCPELTRDEIDECISIDPESIHITHNAFLKNYTHGAINQFLNLLYSN